MAKELNTDVAAEVNISARRNDTFKLVLEVRDSEGAIMDLTAMNSVGNKPVFQAKMSIVSDKGENILNAYSYHWADVTESAADYTNVHPPSRIPSSTNTGFITGGSSDLTSAITLASQAGVEGEKISVIIPYDYMVFQPGTYKYDFQIRKSVGAVTLLEYTTWIYGSFTLKADITQA
tara:strand:- start:12805 stop:13335 length:531 start_codon:yes stop_codon:yes gene_type:complete